MNETKPKILMIAATPFFSDRGCHIRIYNEIKHLSALGFEVVLATYHNGKNIDGIETRRIINVPWYKKISPGASFAKPYLDFLLFFTTLRAFWHFKPNVIHAHLYEGLCVAWLVKILTFSKVPIVFDFQGSLAEEMYEYHLKKYWLAKPFYYLFWLAEKLMLYLPDSIVCSSEKGAIILRDKFKVGGEIAVINDGFDSNNRRATLDECRALKEKLGIPPKNKVVLYTGSLTTAKGVQKYLEAISEIAKKRQDITFLFVGYGDLQRLSEKNIIFTGRVSYFELYRYLSIADIAIDPKAGGSESSAKIMNYLMFGIPTVCLSVPIDDLKSYVTIISDFKELAEIIDKPLSRKILPPELINKYSNPQILNKLELVYENEKMKLSHRSNLYNFLFLLVISIVCLVVFYHYSSVALLISIIQKTNPFLLGLSFLIYLFVCLLRAFRFSLISPLKSLKDNFIISSIHTFVNNVLPAETGELAYPYLLKKLHNVAYTKSVADLFVVRVFDFANVCVFLIAGLLVFLKFNLIYLVFFVILSQLLIVSTYLILIRRISGFVAVDQTQLSVFGKVKNFFGEILAHQSTHSFYSLLRLHLLSCAIVLIMFFYSYILMSALGLHIAFQFFVIGWGFSLIGSFLPIQGFFGFGSMEAGWFFPLVLAGLSQPFSIALSINYHLISLMFSFGLFAFAGLVVLKQKRLRSHLDNKPNNC